MFQNQEMESLESNAVYIFTGSTDNPDLLTYTPGAVLDDNGRILGSSMLTALQFLLITNLF